MKHVGRHAFKAYSTGGRRPKLIHRCEKCGKPKPETKAK